MTRNLSLKIFKYKNFLFFQIVLKVVSLLAPIILIPWILNSSSKSDYGKYLALLALVNFALSFDLGIANLSNGKIAEFSTKNQELQKNQYIILSLKTLQVLFGILILPVLFSSYLLLAVMEGVTVTGLNSSILSISIITVASVYFGLLGNLGLKIDLAHQRNLKVICLMTLQALIPFIGMIFYRNHFSLFRLAIFFILIPQILVWFNLLARVYKQITSSSNLDNNFTKRNISKLINEGFIFLFLQIATVVSTQIDALIVAILLNSESAAEISITWRYFAIPLQFMGILALPLWGLTASSRINKTEKDVFRKLKKLLVINFIVFVLFSFMSLLIAPPILNSWTSGVINPNVLLLIACSLWLIVSGLAVPVASMLNGWGDNRFLFRIYSVSTVFNFVLSITFTKVFDSNIGVLVGSTIAQTFFFLVPALFFLRRETSNA